MPHKRSPHEVLGIAPGADRGAIDAAYRRLIKQHHPDLAGGDGETTRAIIHAYRHLARESRKLPVRIHSPAPDSRGRARWLWETALLFAASMIGILAWPLLQPGSPRALAGEPAPEELSQDAMAHVAADGASVEDGVSVAGRLGRQSADLVIGYSRSCAADLERLPGEALLDHCLAFDIAAARGPAGGEAWFKAGTMALRHGEAANKVLGEPALAQSRVRDVRRLVERERLLRR